MYRDRAYDRKRVKVSCTGKKLVDMSLRTLHKIGILSVGYAFNGGEVHFYI
jgi:hypothetical protein